MSQSEQQPDGTSDSEGASSPDGARETAESGAPAEGRAVRDRFSTDEIFQRIVATAEEEFSRSSGLLFLSGLAAGLSMSLSLVGAAALEALIPGPYARAFGNLLYPLGFLFVVMGGYQLFTENTLTPVTLVLTRLASIPRLLRIWGLVLVANVVGTGLAAFVLARTAVLSSEAAAIAMERGTHMLSFGFEALFWKAIFAGWLVATLVWLAHAMRESAGRILMLWVIVFTVGVAELAHCIVGACEVLFVVFRGGASLSDFLVGFLAPTIVGNTIGGVLLVAILNYGQIAGHTFIPGREWRKERLSTREWLLGEG